MLAPVNLVRKYKSDIPAADNFAALDMGRRRGIICAANPWKERQPVADGAGFDAGRTCRPVADRPSAASTHRGWDRESRGGDAGPSSQGS